MVKKLPKPDINFVDHVETFKVKTLHEPIFVTMSRWTLCKCIEYSDPRLTWLDEGAIIVCGTRIVLDEKMPRRKMAFYSHIDVDPSCEQESPCN
jgi:hypothetical protein